MGFNVTKRNGDVVPYNPERINSFLGFVCAGLDNVSVSEIAVNSNIMFYDGITTEEINGALLTSANNLIDEEHPDYAIVAGRILLCNMRKYVYGDFEPKHLHEIIKRNTELGVYDKIILEKYSEEEIDWLNKQIDHNRDMMYSISGAVEWEAKYLAKNTKTKEYYETPQVSYMVAAMMYFINDKGDAYTDRLSFVKEHYDNMSLGRVNVPTPHIANLRKPTRSFSSCVLIESDDSIDSIGEAATAARKYATLGAGLGIGSSKLRERNASIRNGAAVNSGALYHAKSIEYSALSCSQGSIRKGSLTFNWWGLHPDIEETLLYKNNMKKDSESMKHSDHSIFLNGFMLKAAAENRDIGLFSPHISKEVYDAFYSSCSDSHFYDAYTRAMNKGEAVGTINARHLMDLLVEERFGTGRVYVGFADNINRHSMYNTDKYPIKQSNLCQEIVLPTQGLMRTYNPVSKTYKQDGLIALCNLSGINFGAFDDPKDLARVAYVTMRAVDNLLDFQEHPFPAAEEHNRLFRPIGIGITGLAYWLAKNDKKYSNCYELLDEWMQYFSYGIISASVSLAEERGACDAYADTRWAEGKLPKDMTTPMYNSLFNYEEKLDWTSLRAIIAKYGVRNASMIAMFPAETSAKISGSGTTNGIEPIRELIISKGGKNRQAKFVVPELARLKDKYDRIWDHTSCEALIKTYAVIQRYTDQAISVNTYYNKQNYPNNKVPASVVSWDIYLHYLLGGKTMYYNNNYDGQSSDIMDGKITEVPDDSNTDDEDDCVACKL